MSKILYFIGGSSLANWLLTSNIDFYKITLSILLILFGVSIDMHNYWKYEATRARIISEQMYMDIDTLYGEGAADKLRSFARANMLKHLKELEESGKEIPDIICKELGKLKTELEKEQST